MLSMDLSVIRQKLPFEDIQLIKISEGITINKNYLS
jgi:hypothetical protein